MFFFFFFVFFFFNDTATTEIYTLSLHDALPICITSDNRPTFNGTAEADSTVEVFLNGASIGTTTADGTGNWSLVYDNSFSLSDDTYDAIATATDAAGNSTSSVTPFTIVVDANTPIAPVILGFDSLINIDEQVDVGVSGTAEPNATIDITFTDGSGATVTGQTTANNNGDWILFDTDLTSLQEGSITIDATSTDAAGNVSSADSVTVTKDITPPSVLTINSPIEDDNIINEAERNSVVISGTTDPGSRVRFTITDGFSTI